VRVCDQWDLDLPEGGSYAKWIRSNLKARSASVTAGYHVYRALSHVPANTALETFGGIGCQSLMIQSMFPLDEHFIVEIDEQAATHLHRQFPYAAVLCGDAYTIPLPPADLVAMDFGDLTALSATRKHRPLLDEVFAANPLAVTVTDVAGPRLHLHRDRYAAIVGTDCSDYATYLSGLAAWFARDYGYQTLACYYHHGAAKMAMIPGSGVTPYIAPVPSAPAGLRL
jgi:hypothetical protein